MMDRDDGLAARRSGRVHDTNAHLNPLRHACDEPTSTIWICEAAQPHHVKDRSSPHEVAQPGADVTADARPGTKPVLPEGWRENLKAVESTYRTQTDELSWHLILVALAQHRG